MDGNKLRTLKTDEQILVSIAVLLDGHEAAQYLEADSSRGANMMDAVNFLSSQPPELRMPLVGSILRGAISRADSKRDK